MQRPCGRGIMVSTGLKPLWLEPSDKGRGSKRLGPQQDRIWVFT